MFILFWFFIYIMVMYMLINYVVFVALFSIFFFLYFVDYSTIVPHSFWLVGKSMKRKKKKKIRNLNVIFDFIELVSAWNPRGRVSVDIQVQGFLSFTDDLEVATKSCNHHLWRVKFYVPMHFSCSCFWSTSITFLLFLPCPIHFGPLHDLVCQYNVT